MSTTSTQRRLTPAEVHEYFEGKISMRTLANWRSQGKGPKFLRLEGKIMYPLDELQKWEQDSLYSSTSNYKAAS